MRPRLILAAIALTALPIGLALLLGRQGGTRTPAGPGAVATQISLSLKRPSGDTRLVGCGLVHHYAAYRAGATILFDGAVADPPGTHWKVRVKLKSCIAGAFRPAGDSAVRQHPDGSFKGSFPAPVPGLYFARASVDAGGSQLARSYKRFFVIR